MRPIFAVFFSESLRSRFSRSRSSENKGSRKLSEQKNELNESKSGNNSKGAGIISHKLEGRKSRGWYSATVSALAARDEEETRGREEEEMVPVGKIGVKHNLEWREDRELHWTAIIGKM